ncbi:leucyl aminopeptidase [Dongia deserti]|uniref:leucyl aminopeptidase n=1 Tax=Dongia deserti TaxID=2268030 RepID=UPI0013C4F812|nr:leucyl aminopeptidase [Dongia deserti]
MQIEVIAKPAMSADVTVVFAAEGKKLLGLGAPLGKALQKAMAAPSFSAKRGEILDVLGAADTRRVIIAGVGNPKELSAIRARKIGGKIAAHLLQVHEPKAQILGGGVGRLDDAVFLGNVALGARLRGYRFGKYVTQAKPGNAPAEIAALSLVTAQRAATQKIAADAEALATGICFARDQVNEPPSTLWPDAFAKRLLEFKKHGIAVEIYDEGALRKMGAGGILAVAQGSQHPPRLVVLRWNGRGKSGGGKSKEGPVTLVGKGVCFDSGGLSLKRTSQMLTMKGDMGGAAAVAGAILTAALRKAKVDVVGVMALVENMPSGSSYRPGDIVKTLAGKTMEIIDTDAEGRVTLVDSLYYAASKFNPSCILDAATLTYSVSAALGPVYAGLFANQEALAREVQAAGQAAGEELWRLPLDPDYVKNLKSKVADYRQVAPDDLSADAAHAAALLSEFVDGRPWAHLDIANKEFATKDTPLCPEGATGYGVALFDAFLRQRE